MNIIGGLAILGGIILCAVVWPGDPGSGYYWKATAYTPSMTWLFSGLVSGMLFFAVGSALTYLHGTRELTELVARTLLEQGESEVDDSESELEAPESQTGGEEL